MALNLAEIKPMTKFVVRLHVLKLMFLSLEKARASCGGIPAAITLGFLFLIYLMFTGIQPRHCHVFPLIVEKTTQPF